MSAAYPQQGFPGLPPVPPVGGYPSGSLYGGMPQQPFQAAPYGAPPPTYQPQPSQTALPGQGYPSYAGGLPPRPTPPTSPDRRNTWLVIATVGVAVLLILLLFVGVLAITRGGSQTAASVTPTVTTVPTVTPSPTPSPTPSHTPTPSPSPTASPTAPAPNPGFSWCDQCRNEGFTTQYPSGWSQSSTPDGTGIRFTSPDSGEIFASFKASGPTTQTPDQLVASDIQALQPAATNISPTTTTTIGGTTWRAAAADYQPGQVDHIQVYATVYQGKAYLIEIQAPQASFQQMNNQFFATMLATFQFL